MRGLGISLVCSCEFTFPPASRMYNHVNLEKFTIPNLTASPDPTATADLVAASCPTALPRTRSPHGRTGITKSPETEVYLATPAGDHTQYAFSRCHTCILFRSCEGPAPHPQHWRIQQSTLQAEHTRTVSTTHFTQASTNLPELVSQIVNRGRRTGAAEIKGRRN